MTKDALWTVLTTRNPHFLTGSRPIAFTPASLRKFFDTVWDQAQNDMDDRGDLPKVLKDIFSGRKP